jgi:hypothetical protein
MAVDVAVYTGAACTSGTGYRVTSGYDTNYDGNVEVTLDTAYVCNGANGATLSASNFSIVSANANAALVAAQCPADRILISGTCEWNSDIIGYDGCYMSATLLGGTFYCGYWSADVLNKAYAICLKP